MQSMQEHCSLRDITLPPMKALWKHSWAHNNSRFLGLLCTVYYVRDFLRHRKCIAQDGTIKATVGQQPGQMGRLAVEAALSYLKGAKVPAEIKAPLTLVTKDNAASFRW